MKTNTGKTTLASKYNLSGKRVFIPEKAHINGLDYVRTYKLQYINPSVAWEYLITLDRDVKILFAMNPVAVDIRTPFTLDMVKRYIRMGVANIDRTDSTSAKQIIGTKYLAEELVPDDKRELYDTLKTGGKERDDKLLISAEAVVIKSPKEYDK